MFRNWIIIELISDEDLSADYTIVRADEVTLTPVEGNDDIYEVKNSVGDVIAYTCESASYNSLEAAKKRLAVEEMMEKSYDMYEKIPEWLYELNIATLSERRER